MFLVFICDLPNECAGFFDIAQNDITSAFFVILNERFSFVCHSERAFGRGRILTVGASLDW